MFMYMCVEYACMYLAWVYMCMYYMNIYACAHIYEWVATTSEKSSHMYGGTKFMSVEAYQILLFPLPSPLPDPAGG